MRRVRPGLRLGSKNGGRRARNQQMPKMVPPALRRSAVAAASLGAIWFAGLVWFATVPSAEAGTEPTDAIVVLTGGSQRLNSGIALLREGKGRKLFISGVNHNVDLEDLLRSSGEAVGR